MTDPKKSDYLDRLEQKEALDEADFLFLKDLSSDSDPYIRSCIPIFLMNFQTEDALAVLITLGQDSDPLVRTEAYDSMSAFGHQTAADFLRDAIQREQTALARAYAITAWAEVTAVGSSVTEDAVTFALKRQSKEKNRQCRLCWNYALYRFGGETHLNDLLRGLQEKNYHLRRHTLSILSDILGSANSPVIRASLLALLETETVPAVRDEAARLLKMIEPL